MIVHTCSRRVFAWSMFFCCAYLHAFSEYWHRAMITKYQRDKSANKYQNEMTMRNQLIYNNAIALDAIDLFGANYSPMLTGI